MRDPMEDIIASAMMSGDQETGMRRITCNAAARTMITCGCGEVLDQETITVIEHATTGKTVIAYCPSCYQRAARLWNEDKYVHVKW